MIRSVINKIPVTNALICMTSHTSFICLLFTRNVECNLYPILPEVIGPLVSIALRFVNQREKVR